MTTTPARLRRALVAGTAATVLVLAGCGGDTDSDVSPESSESTSPSPAPSKDTKETSPPAEAEEVTIDVTIEGDQVTPVAQSVEIGVGETLVLDVTSDRAGELHVHSSPEQELEFQAGSTPLDVTLDQPGSVDIEEHESGALVVRVLVK